MTVNFYYSSSKSRKSGQLVVFVLVNTQKKQTRYFKVLLVQLNDVK